ncbi:hypothetical protein [Porticoccus sp.]|uniref:hypothetical protein n=1 Tax=Porticoccus sp. TaxID=2024853 RepID=UPI003F6994DC
MTNPHASIKVCCRALWRLIAARLLPITAAATLLAGCSTNVVVNSDYPTALVIRQPISVGLVLDNSFSSYRFTSEKDNRQTITMALGESQVKLFNRVFSDMFQNSATLQTLPGGQSKLDLMIVPEITEVQLATPMETQLNVYEVWLKYNLKVYDGNGQPIADWMMSAYGKTQSRFLKSDEEALNQATVLALRDAGARLLTGFQQIPEIRQWLVNRQPPAKLSRSTAP